MRNQGQPGMNGGYIDAEFEEDAPAGGSNALATVRGPGGGMMQTRTQYSTAMITQVPRDLATTDRDGKPKPNTVLAKVLREASIAGEDFLYSMTFKSKDGPSTIEGVSIDGAMILARNFMNCATECEVVEEGPTHWIFKATFIDHETGFTEARLFRQNKSQRSMRGDPERMLDIAFQIGQSKAKRNAIVRAMPTWLVDQAVTAAKAAAAAKIKDLPKAIEDVKATFKAKFNVEIGRLEKYLNAPVAQWNARDIVRLRSVYKAIIDRQTTVENEFPVEEEKKAEAPPPETNAITGEAKPAEGQNIVTGEPKTEASTPPAQPPATIATPEPPKEPEKPKAKEEKREKPSREPGEEG